MGDRPNSKSSEKESLGQESSDLEIPGFRARREAREEALALLYQAEMLDASVDEVLAAREVPPADYAIEIAQGVHADLVKLDELIEAHLTDWKLERLGAIERALLRIASWELTAHPDTPSPDTAASSGVPTGVIVSEAVALATQ